MVTTLADELRGDSSASTHESFQEWLESVAASEGVSQEEVLDQMMSSYWMLSELSEMMDEGDFGKLGGGSNTVDQQLTPDQHQSDVDQDDTDAETEFKQIIKLAKILNESSGPSDTPQQETDPQLVGKLDQLHDDVDQLADRLNELVDHQHDPESAVPVDSTEVEDLADWVEELEARVTDLAQTVEANEDQTDEKFDQVEDILEYLVGRVDEFDKRIDDLANEVTLLAGETDENALAALKQEANRKEIRTATCDACDFVVDIGLLESAMCPNCDYQFDRIETEDRLFGLQRSHVLSQAPSEPEDGGPIS